MICSTAPARTLAGLADANARAPAAQRLILTLDLPDLLTADKSRRENWYKICASNFRRSARVCTAVARLRGADTAGSADRLCRAVPSLDKKDRDAILGVTFTRRALKVTTGAANWGLSGRRGYNREPGAVGSDARTNRCCSPQRRFSFSRQMQGTGEIVTALLADCWTVRTWM